MRSLFVSVICVFFIKNAYAQNSLAYSLVDADSMNLSGFKYNDNIKKCIQIFGDPVSYKTYDQSGGMGPEGRDKLYYIDYDSLSFTFYEFQHQIFLDGYDIIGRKYKLNIKGNNIGVGDSLADLKDLFPKSFEIYQENYTKPYKDKEQEFIVLVEVRHSSYIQYGLIHFYLSNDIINKIGILMDESS